MKSTRIYMAPDLVMIDAGYEPPVEHHHQAVHILIGQTGAFWVQIGGEEWEVRGCLINSNAAHCVEYQGEEMLVFLIEGSSDLGENIRKRMDCKTFEHLEDALAMELLSCFQKAVLPEKYISFRHRLIQLMQLDDCLESVEKDPRILEVLEQIRQAKKLGPGMIRELAAKNCLSESRLSHLFKEQMMVPLSTYLILYRIQKTYYHLAEGMNITQACLEAGFAGSAHFAAVHRQLFGIAASSVTQDVQYLSLF